MIVLVPFVKQMEDPVTSLECAETREGGIRFVTTDARINAIPNIYEILDNIPECSSFENFISHFLIISIIT